MNYSNLDLWALLRSCQRFSLKVLEMVTCKNLSHFCSLAQKLSLCLVLKVNGKVMNHDPVKRICGLRLGTFLNHENMFISLSQTAMTEPKADSAGGEFNSNMTADQLHKRPVNDTENGSHFQVDEESQQNNNVVVDGATELTESTERLADVGYYDILKQFSLMGWVAFGGPAAHIALFQKVSLGIALTRFQSARTSYVR